MGIYYYALDTSSKQYFSPPREFANKSPGIFHPKNPFGNMILMKNIQGYSFDVWNDCSHDIPPSNDYKDVTEEVYQEYLNKFREET